MVPSDQLRVHQNLGKLVAISQYLADASLHSTRYSSWAIAVDVSARRLLWLKTWRADLKAKWRLATKPYAGGYLFGAALDPYLVEDLPPTGRSSPGWPTLAKMTVVRGPDGALRLTSMEDPGRSYFPHSGGTPTPGPAVAPTNRLVLERRALSQDSYSSRVIAMIQQSRRPSMNRIYDATWRSFCTWCAEHRVELSGISVPIVLEFLMDELDKGLSPNTIRRQVAALTTVLTCDNATSLTHHLMVCSFLKGATNAKPPTVHRYPSWDLHQVLQALVAPPFEPIDTCPLKLLSMKVAFLVAVTSARRISELAALSVREDLSILYPDRIILRLDPSFIPKVNSFSIDPRKWFYQTSILIHPMTLRYSGTHWTFAEPCNITSIGLQPSVDLRHCLFPPNLRPRARKFPQQQ
ncbi:uncharacterized protein LOC120300682 [Crotalus tigris]|uniref:uncharacterized protein LOC120300682 n=1 Tax=Crotalus tigris TaxID=88082 RepID=UPI00192F5DD3|nr:uncharacterized protein LOC120300682 [Crotalus tigris]